MAISNPLKRLVRYDNMKDRVGLLIGSHRNCRCTPTTESGGNVCEIKGTYFYDGVNYTIVRKLKGMFKNDELPDIVCGTTGKRIDTLMRVSSEYNDVNCESLCKEFRQLVEGKKLSDPVSRTARQSARQSARMSVRQPTRQSARPMSARVSSSQVKRREPIKPTKPLIDLLSDSTPSGGPSSEQCDLLNSVLGGHPNNRSPCGHDSGHDSYHNVLDDYERKNIRGTPEEQILVNELKIRMESQCPATQYDCKINFDHFYRHLMRRFCGKVLPIVIDEEELADTSIDEFITDELNGNRPVAAVVMIDMPSSEVYNYLFSPNVDKRIKLIVHRQQVVRVMSTIMI